MLLKTKGKSYNISEPIVGRVTRDSLNQNDQAILISNEDFEKTSFKAVLSERCLVMADPRYPTIAGIPSLAHLAEGDIVLMNSDGVINTLYRAVSHQNFLLATERCNSNCLMCSQPPRDRNDIEYLFQVHQKLIPLIPKDCPELGITGGEPTLMGSLFFSLLKLIKQELPDTEVHCLTNGRTFAWPGMAKKLGSLSMNRLMLGIPLYSDYYQVHDYIVQAKDAYNQTLQGLHQLALHDQRIEVRIVLHQQSIPRLTRLARFIYKNLPFVEHVAFMGLEYQGYTPHNIHRLWIDPVDYMSELCEAVHYLSSKGMNVSIYNSQLCLIPKDLWPFCRKSISDWKNIYLPECKQCSIREECGGLFASCANMHSASIKPMQHLPDLFAKGPEIA